MERLKPREGQKLIPSHPALGAEPGLKLKSAGAQSMRPVYPMLCPLDLCELKASNSNTRLITAKSRSARAPGPAGPAWALILHNWVN